MYPLKIKEKYDVSNLASLWNRFSTVYLWNYIPWDFREWVWSHPWVDIVPISKWQEVLSVMDWVVFKAWEDWAYWKYVFIEHKDVYNQDFTWKTTLYSCYEHLSNVLVKTWDVVKEWQVIWKTWNTWISFWEHLHFQIDLQEAPFHAYWPYSWVEVQAVWKSFSDWVNLWLWLDKAKNFTINPLVYLDKLDEFRKNNIINSQKENLIVKNEEKLVLKRSSQDDIITDNTLKTEEYTNNVVTKTESNEVLQKKEPVIIKEEKIEVKKSEDVIVDNSSDLLNTMMWDDSKKKNLNWQFKDISKDNKYFSYIEDLSKKWYIFGYSDRTFRPNSFITRVEFLKLLFLINQVNLIEYDYQTFLDVKAWIWQKKYVDTRLWLGLISKNNKFFPNYNISISQAMKIAIKLVFWDIDNSYNWVYEDVNWNEWYAKYAQFWYENKLLNLWKYFYPNTNITRIQVVELLYNLSNKKKTLEI